MSVEGLNRKKHLEEFTDGLMDPEGNGWLDASERQALARANLGLPVSAAMADSYVEADDAAAALTLTEDDHGKVVVIPNFTSTGTITLPAGAPAGFRVTVISKAVAADAQNAVIDTGSDTNFFLGGVVHLDANSGTGADELVPLFPNGSSNSVFTMVTPGGGTRIDLVADGTNWIINGYVVSDTIPTFADQA